MIHRKRPYLYLLLAAALAHASTDSVQVSFTAIHSQHRNWLQTQVSPVGACQEVVVDSVRVLDDKIRTYVKCGDTSSGLALKCEVLSVRMGNVPYRDLQVAWHLEAMDATRNYAKVVASRNLREIPAPRKSPTTDTLLYPWAIGRIEAIGPDGQRDTVDASMIDQSGNLSGVPCPVYDLWCPTELAYMGPDSMLAIYRDSALESLRQRVAAGQTIVRVGATATNQGLRMAIPFGGLTLPFPWSAGNQAFSVSHPLQVRRSWGPAPVREFLERETGERIELWKNSGREAIGDTLSTSGMDLELSNDSTFLCDWLKMPDQTLASDLARSDWLLFPDSAEVRTGVLTGTFKNNHCGVRENAMAIVNDSVFLGGVWIPMALLDQALGVSPSRRRVPALKVSVVTSGVRVSMPSDLTESVTVRVRTISGRLLTQTLMTSSELILPLSGHGLFLVEAESREGIARARVVR